MNHAVTRHRGGNASADVHGGEGPWAPELIYPAMLRVMGLVSKRHIDPADGNCAPSGFKEYDKRTNGFALKIFAVISGCALG